MTKDRMFNNISKVASAFFLPSEGRDTVVCLRTSLLVSLSSETNKHYLFVSPGTGVFSGRFTPLNAHNSGAIL